MRGGSIIGAVQNKSTKSNTHRYSCWLNYICFLILRPGGLSIDPGKVSQAFHTYDDHELPPQAEPRHIVRVSSCQCPGTIA